MPQTYKSNPTITEVSQKVIQAAKETLGERLDRIILYGSYARRDFEKDSDVDYFVLANVPQEEAGKWRDGIYKLLPDIGLDYDIIVSIKVTGNITFKRYADVLPFYMNVVRDGIVLYE